MKNLKYFPFERNKYFYGKLLTVDDFESEQRYLNDKRRVLNRFLYGTGVVCGMTVVTVDDTTISIEPGLALDFSGREIVIDVPVVKKLSMIDGFDGFLRAEDETQYLYLCLDYKETEEEPVHNITGSDSVEYNKYQEGYRLSVTDREPDADNLSNSAFHETVKTVYLGNGMKICQILPQYVETGKEFDLKITIENMGQLLPIRFSYDLELICLESQAKHTVRISFDEETCAKNHHYEQIYRLKAAPVKDTPGTLEIQKGSFQFYAGGRRTEARAELRMSVRIVNSGVREELISNYYKSAMEDIVKSNYQQSIYLAKIYILRAGESYVIDVLDTMPFRQFIYNNVLSDVMNQLSLRAYADRNEKEPPVQERIGKTSGAGDREEDQEIATGHVIMDLGIGGTAGQRFFSEEISHDLGLGKVAVVLGQCYEEKDESILVYGSSEVFEDNGAFRAELAAKTDSTKGVFQIGLRLIEPTMARFVRIEWTALKNPREIKKDEAEWALLIKPEMLYLKVRESYYLETRFQGVEETQVIWSVMEENGGTIEQNGKYTAPNTPGIYEVMARSSRYEDLKAMIFIVVQTIEREGD